jgi:ssRNA-specific RNase YbeY (16S rRNA maturation enzyme)
MSITFTSEEKEFWDNFMEMQGTVKISLAVVENEATKVADSCMNKITKLVSENVENKKEEEI